jgi:hypothetical protein
MADFCLEALDRRVLLSDAYLEHSEFGFQRLRQASELLGPSSLILPSHQLLVECSLR